MVQVAKFVYKFVYNSAIFGVVANLITLLAGLIKNTPIYVVFFLLVNLGMLVVFILTASIIFNVKEIDDALFMWSTFTIENAIYLAILAAILPAVMGVYPFSLLGIPPPPIRMMVVASSIPVVTTLMTTLAYIFELMQRIEKSLQKPKNSF